jgi:(E)-4-hydroxy-3-methylbut-2-enyl-diphosphate synthase
MEFLRICRREDFNDVVLSINASNTVVMVRSVRLLVQAMDREDMHYPLHLGVTEAGEGEDGRIKSAVGIGALLTEGLGDTIRVSLSEEPECEIPVAKSLVSFIDECAAMRYEAENSAAAEPQGTTAAVALAAAGQRAYIANDTLYLIYNNENAADLQLKAAMTAGAILIDGKAHELTITCDGVQQTDLADAILQAARVKFTKTEYISCPGCGRTLYDLQGTIARIKAAVKEAAKDNPRFNTLKIGIMGCIVNGPGEMADADFGYVGAGPGKISLYKGKVCIEKAIPEAEAVEKLIQFIMQNS